MAQVQIYDTTLRDGTQREGISLSVLDKLRITHKLDELGVHFIEGGWPGSNQKDVEYFRKAKDLKLAYARIVAFGMTRKPKARTETDANLRALVDAGVKFATIVGKSSAPQVTRVLETTLEENLDMIGDSIHFLKSKGMDVFLDAEHFFDGYKADPDYSLRCLATAAEAGAACLVLCDTNGGTLPNDIRAIIQSIKKQLNTPLGIHVHNDSELAVANSLAAVAAGVTQVQGTINGYGERCGNANLCSIIPNLKLKMGVDCLSDDQLAKLTEVSHFVSEVANLAPESFAPYVGSSAFSHKAGLHVSGISKWPEAYQHVDPEKVGNKLRVLISELSGGKNIILKAKEMGVDLPLRGEEAQKLLEMVKLQESKGFQYDNAEASFELLVHRARPGYVPPFELVDYMIVVEKKRRPATTVNSEELLSEAMVKVKIDNEIIHTAAEGNGPVNALDAALRKTLSQFYPSVNEVKLVDYKVRILEESVGTGSYVRVLIESANGGDGWRTVGSSTNLIEASWLALADSLEYWLIKQKQKKSRK